MSLELVSPKAGLISAVAERLRPDGKDYSRYWVVFPERRPAYYLRKELAEREGSGFIPPRTASIESFVDQVYGERLGRRDRAIDALDAVAILFEIHQSAPSRLGQEHFLTADQFFPLGTKLFRDLEELAGAAVTKDGLLQADLWGETSVPEATRERLQSVSFFYEKFYERLEARGLSTRASRLSAVAGAIEPEMFKDEERIIFAGFFSLAKTEATLIKKMLEHLSVDCSHGRVRRNQTPGQNPGPPPPWDKFDLLLLEGKGIEDVLDRLEIKDPELRAQAMKAETGGETPPIEIIKSPDSHGQVFALNQALAPIVADRARLNERTVIVLPASETLFPLYQQTLAGLTPEEFNISLGYPLSRTPIYSFFDKLLELVQSVDEEGRVYAPHYLRFVLHPYTKNIYFGGHNTVSLGLKPGTQYCVPNQEKRSDLTRILFHAIEEELTARRTRAFWPLEELESDPAIMRAVQERTVNVENAPDVAAFMEHLRSIHAALIAPFRQIRDVGDFAAKLIAALDYIYENSTARIHYFFHPYAEAFMAQLDALGRSLLSETVFTEPGSYYNLFRKVVSAGTVPFEGTPLHGLQVLGFWETRGLPFEDVFILDMNEDVLPASKRADSLLPFAARRALGLPTYKDNERRMEYYLDTLIRGAKRVRMFFVENNDKERSRYVEKAIWEKQKRENEKRAEKFVRTVRYEVALQAAVPGAVEKTPEVVEFLKGFTFSATALDSYLKCPLMFYHAYVLGLREKEEVGEEMEKKDIGTFVHSILEEYFGRFEGKVVRSEDLREAEMEAIVERRFKESFGDDLSGGLYLMKIQTQRHLREFLTDYQMRIIEGLEKDGKSLKILGLEKKFGGEYRGFKLTAKVDRTETRGDDFYVLDYKTSANTKYLSVNFNKLVLEDRDSWTKHVASVQLPLYNLILSRAEIGRQLPISRPQINCLFVMIGRNRLSPRIEFSAFAADKMMRDYDKKIAELGSTIHDSKSSPAQCAEASLTKEAALAAKDAEIQRRIALMDEIIAGLLLEITDPAVPFDPTRRRDSACEFCSFRVICGTT
jgi:ATP-dependent helicase/nuclease subunit B